jgi:aminoglycoside 6'-N-acetyltransferase I
MPSTAERFTIRPATRADVPDWARMREALWPEGTAAQHRAELEQWFATEPFHGWLAFEGPAAVGFAEASLRPYANGCDGRPVAFLEGLWVQASVRGQGVGWRLVAAVETWAKAQGLQELGSDTALSNLGAQRAHERWGFEETERVVYFRKRL